MRKRPTTIKYGAVFVSLLLIAALLTAAMPAAAFAGAAPTPEPTLDPKTGRIGGLLYLATLRVLLREGQAITDKGYTTQSWQRFTEAMAEAERCMNSANTQFEVNAAADELRAAIDGLHYPDKERLHTALDEGKKLIEQTEAGAAWQELYDALREGEALADAGDQEEINACADRIWSLIVRLEDAFAGTTVVYQDRIVTVTEAPQATDAPAEEEIPSPSWSLYLLLGISLALNAVLVLVFVYLPYSKKNQEDNTPVVSYSIGDDE